MVMRFFAILLILLTACGAPESISEDTSSDFITIADDMGYTWTKTGTREKSILQALFADETEALRSIVLLQNNDRLAAVWWKKSRDTMRDFGFIKQIIFSMLSSDARDIVDEVIERDGYVPVHIFTFSDDAFFEERILFATVRSTLLEFHVREEEMDEVLQVIENISRI